MFLEARELEKSYNKKRILNNVNFGLEKGEILCLLGPSGSGKTTILNIIGGFTEADKGEVILNGVNITKLPPETREVATVFQSYGLFNHKNVFENVEYGLKFKKISKKERADKVREVLKVVGLAEYETRRIHELSGGQQQRVALARSIVVNPGLILLDEPFSNLDENLKDTMRKELKRLVNYFGMTAVLVTHDQEDAFIIADKVILLNDGKIVQSGTPENIYNNPEGEFSVNFIGKSNKLGDNKFVRPEKVRIHAYDENLYKETHKKNGYNSSNIVKGKIVEVIFKGALIEYKLILEDGKEISSLELNREETGKAGETVLVEY